MARPRKQTYTLEMYLSKMKDADIRSDADVQRLSGQWEKSTINELILTVLTDSYIPPIILGEEKNSQLWIIDGLQRSSSLMLFRYGNYRITSSVEESVISYRAKVRDEKGDVKMDGNGNIIWEDAEFNIKNKTYDNLPEELKKRFNEYQIETVIHEDYDMKQISKLVRLYNNQKSMNTAQRAFTYVDTFARKIREILGNAFFINNTSYTQTEKKNGTLERVVMETIMCMFHLENWKKSKQMGAYLNETATMEEFETLNDNLDRLQKVLTDDLYRLFTSKDSFLWLTLFHKFTCSGLEDRKFAEFLLAFQDGMASKEVNGMTFETIDQNRSTKDKSVISNKLAILETLLCEYLHLDKEEITEIDALEFIHENGNPDATQEDMELYQDMLRDYAGKVEGKHRGFDKHNKASWLALIAYACKNEIKLDEWVKDYFSKIHPSIRSQKEHFLYMKKDIESFTRLTNVA